MMTNLATNKNETKMFVNNILTVSIDDSGKLSLRGYGKKSALLYSVDSKQMINFLMAKKNDHPFDMFVTFTCNQKLQFRKKTTKKWVDGNEWQKTPIYENLYE